MLDLPPLSEADALAAFHNLASQHWLVTPDPLDPDFVIHRSDMRLVLLPLLYRDEPELCARIDDAAVTWFGKRPDPASQLDAAYHRLQLLRERKTKPLISNALAVQFDPDMIAELPPEGQQIVLRASGGRTSIFQGSSSTSPVVDDQQLAAELSALVDKQDWAEGQYVVDRALDAGGFDARSQAADAIRAFYWRAGKWVDARRLLKERERLGADDSDLMGIPWTLALARLEMLAEFRPLRLAAALTPPLYQRLLKVFARPVPSPAVHGALAFRPRGARRSVSRNFQPIYEGRGTCRRRVRTVGGQAGECRAPSSRCCARPHSIAGRLSFSQRAERHRPDVGFLHALFDIRSQSCDPDGSWVADGVRGSGRSRIG